MTNVSILILRILIAIMFLGMVTLQVLIFPMAAAQTAAAEPEVSYLQLPFTVLLDLVALGAEVILACIWALLSLVKAGSIFNRGAFRFVNIIVGALTGMGTILFGIFLYLTLILDANPPVIALALLGGITGCFALALLMVVMRGLLRQATDMDEFMQVVA